MNLNYAIFRSEPIMTMSDLRQIRTHNNREKQVYNSNPNIKLELSKDNIELIPINTTYTKVFKEITKEYEKEHNERMKATKKAPFSKTQLLIEKDAFDCMNKIINETKKVIELKLKMQELFSEVNYYTKNHQTLEIKSKYAKINKIIKN